MTTKTNQRLQITKTIVMCSMILTMTIAVSNVLPEAFATCGTATKYYALAYENPTTKGVEAKVTVKDVSICGTTNNQSYAHAEVSEYTSGTSQYVEGGIWKGYGSGEQSGADLAYNYIVTNSYNIFDSNHFEDITDATGHNPDIDDVVKFTVYYDYSSGGKDYYKIIINNETQSHTITVSNIWSNGQGNYGNVHTEILNHDSEIKADFDIIKDYSGSSWSNWSSSGSTDTSPLCADWVSSTHYKMGVESGGSCSTS